IEITVSPKTTTAPNIDQWLITVDKDRKSALLSHLINDQKWVRISGSSGHPFQYHPATRFGVIRPPMMN
ncbi:MAG: hypothetical protein PSN46_10310, partial [Gammaproteobacteria bacterium]|nr:hypothetical protein [Gammaproteobacteria bacterium]